MSSVPAQGFNVLVAEQFMTVTASGNSGPIANNQGLNMGAVLTVSSALGTNPTLNGVLQTSQDNGATWQDVWHFEQLTGPGSSVMPFNKIAGLHRYLWTVGGTTPSFTFEVTETGSGQDAPLMRRFFDYTATLLQGVLNAVSAAFRVDGAKSVSAYITLAAGGTPGSYLIETSPDGVNWASEDTAVAAVAAGTVVVNATFAPASYVRVRCSVAASVATTPGSVAIVAL